MNPIFTPSFETYAIILPIIFLAGLIDAIAGGGGLLSVPGYLATGMPPSMVLGTNKFSAVFGTAVSTARFIKHKMVDLSLALKIALVALIGSHFGAKTALLINQAFLRYVLIFVIPLVALFTLRKPHLGSLDRRESVSQQVRTMLAPLVAAGIGFYDGFFGPGTGSFLVLFFTSVLKYDFTKANGNTKVVNLATNVAALVTFIRGDVILYQVGIPAALANMGGNFVGSHFVVRGGSRIVRPVLLFVLLLLFCKILWDLLH